MKSMLKYSLQLLLITVCLKYSSNTNLNSSFICDVIENLYYFNEIDTFPIFRDKFFQDDFPQLMNLFEQISKRIPLPQMHFLEYSSDELRFITNGELSLSIIMSRVGALKALKTAAGRLNRMHISGILIVLNKPVNLKDLKYLLKWLEENRFFRVLVLFEESSTKQTRIFSVSPYPSIQWLNRTNLIRLGNLFAPKTNDFKQYRIETPFIEDVPRVFFYNRNGKQHLVGRNANIIMLLAAHLNINLVKKFQPKADLKMILKQLPNKKSDLSLHSYPMFYLNGFGWSYPLDMVNFCVMVPVHRGVPKNEYIFTAFDFRTWIVVGFAVIFIAVVMKFIDPRKGTGDNDAGMFYFFQSMTLIMYSPNMSNIKNTPNFRQFAFYAQVFLLAFILSCFYSTYLTSFCTQMVFLPPIETVEDLVRANLKIMVIDYDLGSARNYSNFGDQFLKLLYPVPYLEAINKRDNFDHNFAYTIQHDRWFFLDKQQRGLNQPMFRLSNLCFGPHYLVFPLRENSFLTPYLFGFFLRVTQAGLDHYWEEEAFRLSVAMNHSKVLVDRTIFVKPLDLDYFQYGFAGWIVGLFISLVSFIDELFRKNRLRGN